MPAQSKRLENLHYATIQFAEYFRAGKSKKRYPRLDGKRAFRTIIRDLIVSRMKFFAVAFNQNERLRPPFAFDVQIIKKPAKRALMT